MPQNAPAPRRCKDCDGFPVVAITTGTRTPRCCTTTRQIGDWHYWVAQGYCL